MPRSTLKSLHRDPISSAILRTLAVGLIILWRENFKAWADSVASRPTSFMFAITPDKNTRSTPAATAAGETCGNASAKSLNDRAVVFSIILNLASRPDTCLILSPRGSICLIKPAKLAIKSLPTSTETSPTFSSLRARPAYSTARSDSLSSVPPPRRALPI